MGPKWTWKDNSSCKLRGGLRMESITGLLRSRYYGDACIWRRASRDASRGVLGLRGGVFRAFLATKVFLSRAIGRKGWRLATAFWAASFFFLDGKHFFLEIVDGAFDGRAVSCWQWWWWWWWWWSACLPLAGRMRRAVHFFLCGGPRERLHPGKHFSGLRSLLGFSQQVYTCTFIQAFLSA